MPPATPPLAPGNPAPSTRRMVQRLQRIFAAIKPEDVPYLNDQMALIFEQKANASQGMERLQLQYSKAIQQMNAGHPDDALNTFAEMKRLITEQKLQVDARTAAELRVRAAMAFLRLGEQENCLANHNADSCLFPLGPKAVHLLPRGSRAAAQLFTAQLDEYPRDLGSMWLLNLAYMTLGEYPEKVPSPYLIPPERFASEYEMARFVDVSEGLELDSNDLAGGTIVDDFNNDGLYDIVISAWDFKGQIRLFINMGDGTFAERTSEAGLVGETAALNIVQTDYNNDGWLDIWMMRGGWIGKSGRAPSSLLRNNGDGTFTDVTEEAGLLSPHPTMATRWFDYDGDGWLDLFIGNETVDRSDPDWCELFHNNRDGTFTECARVSGINIAAFVKGVACADYDNDGRPDLYLSIRDGHSILLHNDGPTHSPGASQPEWHFSDASSSAGALNGEFGSFGTFFFDYNNDGWQDIVVFGYQLPNGISDIAADYLGRPTRGAKTKLFRNNGNGTFADVSSEAHLDRICHTMGHNYGDLDNDGWLDFYCATGDPDFRTLIPNRMFRNAEGRFFQDVSSATGTGHIQKGHGVSFADLNDDGCQDVYVSMGGAYSGDFARNALFLNPGNTNRWLKLQLVGTKANRAAIGAKIKLTLQTPTGSRDLYRVVSSGGSFGANPLRQEIGLGDVKGIVGVEIQWPGSNTRQTVRGLELNHSYQIREGNDAPLVLKLHPVRLNSDQKSESRLRASTH